MLAPVFVKRIRPAYVMAGGLALAAIGLLGLTQLTAESGLGVLIGASIVYSLGIAPVFTLTNDLIIGAAPPAKAGAASGVSETGAELGGALSIAILGTLGTAVYRTQVEDSIPAAVPTDEADATRETLGGAVGVSDDLPASVASQVLQAAQEAFTQGLQVVALVSAIIAALAGVGVMLFLRGVSEAPSDPAEARAATAAAESH
jgi:DHA2 family multidrug resistance protein-like MFS transporter